MSNPTKLAAEELINRFFGGIGYGFKSQARDLQSGSLPGTTVLASKISSQPIYDLATVSSGKVYLPGRFDRWKPAITEVFQETVGKGQASWKATALFQRRHRNGNAELSGDVILVPHTHALNVSGLDEVRFSFQLRSQVFPGSRFSALTSFRRIIPLHLLEVPELPSMVGNWHGGRFL